MVVLVNSSDTQASNDECKRNGYALPLLRILVSRNVAILARLVIPDSNCGQSVIKLSGFVKLRVHHKVSLLVDVAVLAVASLC